MLNPGHPAEVMFLSFERVGMPQVQRGTPAKRG